MDKIFSCIEFLCVNLPEDLCLTETWLHKDILDENILPKCDYKLVSRYDRVNGSHGGVAIFQRNSSNLLFIDSTLDGYDFACACTACSSTVSLLVLNIYNPPTGSSYRLEISLLRECIENYYNQFLSSYPCGFVVVCGDLNMPDICWATHSATSDYSRQFLDIVDDINCFQLVDVSTHVNGNILDLFLTNNPDLFSVQVNNSILISDHYPVNASLTIPSADTSKKDIPVYSRCSFNAYHFSTFMVNFDYLYENSFRYSAQGFYEEWYNVIHSALHVSIKQKRDKRIDMPFLFQLSHYIFQTR